MKKYTPKNNTYLCYIEYFATGEGLSVWLSSEIAPNKKVALLSFKTKLKIPDYFMVDAFALNVQKEKQAVKNILASCFSSQMINKLFRSNKIPFSGVGDNFFFHFNYNVA